MGTVLVRLNPSKNRNPWLVVTHSPLFQMALSGRRLKWRPSCMYHLMMDHTFYHGNGSSTFDIYGPAFSYGQTTVPVGSKLWSSS